MALDHLLNLKIDTRRMYHCTNEYELCDSQSKNKCSSCLKFEQELRGLIKTHKIGVVEPKSAEELELLLAEEGN